MELCGCIGEKSTESEVTSLLDGLLHRDGTVRLACLQSLEVSNAADTFF